MQQGYSAFDIGINKVTKTNEIKYIFINNVDCKDDPYNSSMYFKPRK